MFIQGDNMSRQIARKKSHTSLLNSDTRDLEMESVPFQIHEQYLENLYRQYNIRVNHALLFYVEDVTEPIIFVDKTEINIGRQDEMGRIMPELDLSVFNGAELGVSRLHSKIVHINGQYLIQDLHSTNFTWLNGHKLLPYQYTPIPDGSIIQIGRLAMNVFVIKR